MNDRALLIIILFFVFSCSKQSKIPILLTDKVSLDNVHLLEKSLSFTDEINGDSSHNFIQNQDFAAITNMENKYFAGDKSFDIDSLKAVYKRIKSEDSKFGYEDAKNWFDVNGLLLQLTGNAIYAEEMERLVFTNLKKIPQDKREETEKQVLPYIFTRNVDHIHLNIFVPSVISYEHSLHGKVKIAQKPDFRETGDFTLHFSMEKTQYIELFIRIPLWAEGATVTVKKVKYFTAPGEYCQIAKKWKEDDIVEVHFPYDKMPSYLKMYN